MSSDNKSSHGLWQDEIKSYLFTVVKSENKTKRCTPTATGIGRNSNNLALDSDETMEYIDFKTLFFLIQSLRGNVGNNIIVMVTPITSNTRYTLNS
jgi:hypothetical protein